MELYPRYFNAVKGFSPKKKKSHGANICVKVNCLFFATAHNVKVSDTMERIPAEIDLCLFTSITVKKLNLKLHNL